MARSVQPIKLQLDAWTELSLMFDRVCFHPRATRLGFAVKQVTRWPRLGHLSFSFVVAQNDVISILIHFNFRNPFLPLAISLYIVAPLANLSFLPLVVVSCYRQLLCHCLQSLSFLLLPVSLSISHSLTFYVVAHQPLLPSSRSSPSLPLCRRATPISTSLSSFICGFIIA